MFARARENARRASCQSNLKQIALGIFMYNQDYDEKLPLYNGASGTTPATSATVSPSYTYGWADSLQPYLKSVQIFQCPSETTSPGAASTGAIPITPDPTLGYYNSTNADYSDYFYNGLAAGVADAAFNSPASTVLLGDSFASNAQNSVWACTKTAAWGNPIVCSTPTSTLALASWNSGASRHLGGANLAFADGHVKWEKATSDTSSTSANVYSGANSTTDTGGAPTFSVQ